MLTAQVTVPGIVGSVPVAVVLRGSDVHVLLPTVHESAAVHRHLRYPIVASTFALYTAATGVAPDAAAQLQVLDQLAPVLDPIEAAEHSLSNRCAK